jgi:hypothetical protein
LFGELENAGRFFAHSVVATEEPCEVDDNASSTGDVIGSSFCICVSDFASCDWDCEVEDNAFSTGDVTGSSFCIGASGFVSGDWDWEVIAAFFFFLDELAG